MKRAIDFAMAAALIAVLSPIMLAIAVAVRLSSPGPAIFRQQRVGLRGQPFTLLKFRTMYADSAEDRHRDYVTALISRHARSDGRTIYKLKKDDRVTPLGRALRRMGLDELPQLFNVVRGDMSLVGPRPALGYEVAVYESWQVKRLSVRPGITGLWQVSGRNRFTYSEMCGIDVAYIDRWSVWLDLAIILRTPWAMFIDRGGAE